ncbi:MAG: hypothetical protein H6922_02620 [Pseudomonadaceae bacterium]|nr:hypothetical protein [Pseudomonadaceae bacterium]
MLEQNLAAPDVLEIDIPPLHPADEQHIATFRQHLIGIMERSHASTKYIHAFNITALVSYIGELKKSTALNPPPKRPTDLARHTMLRMAKEVPITVTRTHKNRKTGKIKPPSGTATYLVDVSSFQDGKYPASPEL